MALAAQVRRELTARSSWILKELPISRRFREPPMSEIPAKETLPFWRTLATASAVSAWAWTISSKSEDGSSSRHSLFPGSEAAYSVSFSMIL